MFHTVLCIRLPPGERDGQCGGRLSGQLAPPPWGAAVPGPALRLYGPSRLAHPQSPQPRLQEECVSLFLSFFLFIWPLLSLFLSVPLSSIFCLISLLFCLSVPSFLLVVFCPVHLSFSSSCGPLFLPFSLSLCSWYLNGRRRSQVWFLLTPQTFLFLCLTRNHYWH